MVEILIFNDWISKTQRVSFIGWLFQLITLGHIRLFLLALNLSVLFSNTLSVEGFNFIVILKVNDIWNLGVIYPLWFIKVCELSLLECLWFTWVIYLWEILAKEYIDYHIPCHVFWHTLDSLLNLLISKSHIRTAFIVLIPVLKRQQILDPFECIDKVNVFNMFLFILIEWL